MTATVHPMPVRTPDPAPPAIPEALIASAAAHFTDCGISPEKILVVSRRCGLPPEWASALATSMTLLEASGR